MSAVFLFDQVLAIQNLLHQSIRLRLNILLRYWAGQRE